MESVDKSRNTWNDRGGGGGGGGGGWIHSQICLRMDFFFVVVETPKYVFTTKWLKLNAFTVWKPCSNN